MAFLTKNQLADIGFKSLGENVLISDRASIYSPYLIEIGNNVRVDDFVILSPGKSIKIGSYVHIGCFTSLIGSGEIILEDFVGLSGRVSIYSSNDDYSGMSLTNPMIPAEYKKVTNGPVHIKKHTIIGSGTIVLPNVTIGFGCSIYAQTLINSNCEEFGVYHGNPCKMIGKRLKKFLDYEKKFTRNNK